MTIILVCNAIGILCGFFHWTNAMYIILGITWTGFFYEYSKITWKLYECLTENEDIDVAIDVRLTNNITVIFLMVMVYFLLYLKTGGLCVIVSAVQCFVFQLLYTYKAYSQKNIVMLVACVIELFFVLLCVK